MMLLIVAAIANPICAGVPLEGMVARYADLQRKQDVPAIAHLFGSDGEVVNSGAPTIRGEVAVLAFLSGFKGFGVSANRLDVDKVVASGDAWRVLGRFSQQGHTPDGKSYNAHGSFDSIWVCGASGWGVRRMETGK